MLHNDYIKPDVVNIGEFEKVAKLSTELKSVKNKITRNMNGKVVDLYNNSDGEDDEKDVKIIETKPYNNNDDDNNSINDDNLLLDHQTKIFYNALIKLVVQYTENQISKIRKFINKEFDKSENKTFDNLLTLGKHIFYNNNDSDTMIDSIKLFEIFLLHQQNNNNINNTDSNYNQSLDILNQIFNNNNNTSFELKLEEQQNKNKTTKNKKNSKVQFNDSLIKLLQMFVDSLSDIISNDLLFRKYNNNKYSIDILETKTYLENLINFKNNDRSSKKILQMILFFANYYNDEIDASNNKKLNNIMVFEKSDDQNGNFINNFNNNELLWYRVSLLFSQTSLFIEPKNSAKTLKSWFSKKDNYNNIILIYDEDIDSLEFYEYDMQTISNQLDYCLNMFIEPLITKYLISNELLNHSNEIYNKSIDEINNTYTSKISDVSKQVTIKFKQLENNRLTTKKCMNEIIKLLNEISISDN